MTRDDIIRMAHEVLDRTAPDEHCREPYWTATEQELELFAKFVRADAIVDEREACARIADSMDSLQDGAIGRVIRRRGNK